jgi:hypothetical protein
MSVIELYEVFTEIALARKELELCRGKYYYDRGGHRCDTFTEWVEGAERRAQTLFHELVQQALKAEASPGV